MINPCVEPKSYLRPTGYLRDSEVPNVNLRSISESFEEIRNISDEAKLMCTDQFCMDKITASMTDPGDNACVWRR